MKKKLIALLLIVLVLVTTAFTCVSCSTGLFEKDAERDYFQSVATVKYKDLSKDIYKGQLSSYVNSYGAYYQQYYSMSVEDIVKYFYNSLTQNALITMYAKYYAYNSAKTASSESYDTYSYMSSKTSQKITELSSKDFLTVAQYIYAIDTTNADLLETFNTEYDTLQKEHATDDADDEEEEDEDDTADLLAARTVRTASTDSATSYKDESKSTSIVAVYGAAYKDVTYGDLTSDYISTTFGKTVKEFAASLSFDNVIKAKIKAESDTDKKSDMKSALKTVQTSIEDSYFDYNYFLDVQCDSVILERYQNELKNLSEAASDKITSEYNKTVDASVKSYINITDYASALSNNTFTAYNASNEYVGVKSILLKFSDDQSAIVTALKAMYASNSDYANELRDTLALGYGSSSWKDTLAEYTDSLGIDVNVSNPLYDSTTDELKDAYTDSTNDNTEVDYAVILCAMANSIASIKNEIYEKFAEENPDATETELKAVEYAALEEAFTQWMYLVNDDSGMFSSDSYLITPEHTATSYVAEYTVLARALAQNVDTNYAASRYVYESGSASTLAATQTAEYTGTTEILQSGNTSYNIDYKECMSYTSDDESDVDSQLTGMIYTLTTNEGNSISFCVNDYGIHIVLLTKFYGKDMLADGIEVVYKEAKTYDSATTYYTYDEGTQTYSVADITKFADGVTYYCKGYVSTESYIYSTGAAIKYDYIYTQAATFEEGKTYYLEAAGSYVEAEGITAFAEGKTYYTRTWGLDSVSIDVQTYGEYLGDTISTNGQTDKLSVVSLSLLKDGEIGKYITKNTKIYDKYIKELTED